MNSKSPDYLMLRVGPILLYYDKKYLQEDLCELEKIGYNIITFDTSKWTKLSCHNDLKEKLNLPDYYGENLNALNDSLHDLRLDNRRGLVLVFLSYDRFTGLDKSFATAVIDIIALQSKQWLLDNVGLICMIQSHNKHLNFEKVGGSIPIWNGNEWFTDSR